MAVLTVRVVSPDRTVFEGEAAAVVAPAWDGRIGVLPGHAPMVALLGAGRLIIDLPGGGSEAAFLAGGVMKVEGDLVTVLTEYAGDEPPEFLPEAVIEPEDVHVEASRGNPLV